MEKIEKAVFNDAFNIYQLIKSYPVEVLPRSISDIAMNIDRFFVCRDKGKLAGTVSWKILPEFGKEKDHIVEIVSLCVDKDYKKQKLGSGLVTKVIDHVKVFEPTKIILLTFVPDFFKQFGFKKVDKESLQNKIYLGCINCTKYSDPLTCPEVAMELRV